MIASFLDFALRLLRRGPFEGRSSLFSRFVSVSVRTLSSTSDSFISSQFRIEELQLPGALPPGWRSRSLSHVHRDVPLKSWPSRPFLNFRPFVALIQFREPERSGLPRHEG